MSALVIIMSIGTKPHFKWEAVRDTAGIGTIGSDRGQGPPSAFGTGPPKSLIRHWLQINNVNRPQRIYSEVCNLYAP